MSLPTFPDRENIPTREEVINQIISSIAMEELGLSHIINSEGEKMQYVLGTIPGVTGLDEPVTMDELLELNKSVRQTLEGTVMNQFLLKKKLESALTASIMRGPTGATGPTGPTGPFLSCYLETLGDSQTVAQNQAIAFDFDSTDDVGNGIVLNPAGTVFTINRAGLYHIEWDINVAPGSTPAVVGILENDAPASGASTSAPGNFSSGALIHVDSVPFTISLFNYGSAITLERPFQWEDSAASIRILRFADGPIE